jgi:hypothetical protein
VAAPPVPTPDQRALNVESARDLAVALIDFDNMFPHADLAGDPAWLAHEINKLITSVIRTTPAVRTLDVRFYGGWLEQGILSQKGSRLQQAISVVNPFPVPHTDRAGLLQGSLSLVTRLLALPRIEWTTTFRRKRGLPRLRLLDAPYPTKCLDQSPSCPIRTLYSFSRRRAAACSVSGCTVTNEDAFLCMEQKMVDTLLACDLLALSGEPSLASLLVLSDDSDFLPAVAVAANVLTAPITIYSRNNQTQTLPFSGFSHVTVEVWQ